MRGPILESGAVKSSLEGVARAPGGLKRQLLYGGGGSLAVKAAYVSLQLVIGVVLARVLGPSDYGSYAFAMAVVALLAIPAQLGFPGLLVRLVAIYQSQGSYRLLKGLLLRSTQVVSCFSTLLAIVGAAVIAYRSSTSSAAPSTLLLIALPLVPLIALSTATDGALRGLGHVVIGQVPNEIARPALTLVIVLLLYTHLTPELAVLASIAATALALAMSWTFLYRYALPIRLSQPQYQTRVWMKAAFPFVLLAAGQVVLSKTDLLMLGLLDSNEQVGMYRAAAQFSDALGMLLVALAAAITPYLAKLYSQGDMVGVKRILVISHRTGFILVLPFSILLSIYAHPLLSLIFGDPYTPATNALVILLIGKLGYATVGFCGAALSMFGLASVATIATGLAAILNVALNILFIPALGSEGAALATALSAAIVNAGLAGWMYRTYRLNVTAFAIIHGREAD